MSMSSRGLVLMSNAICRADLYSFQQHQPGGLINTLRLARSSESSKLLLLNH